MKLPEAVKIESVNFEVGISIKRHALPITAELKALGVRYIRESLPSMEVEGQLKCKTREEYVNKINALCESVRMKPETVRVKFMNVRIGANTAVLSRTRKTTKEGGGTKQVTVLGIFEHTGNLNQIVKTLNAGKFVCKYELTTIRTVICSGE
jgi:hypothetical protein